jgi:hypothetical protein
MPIELPVIDGSTLMGLARDIRAQLKEVEKKKATAEAANTALQLAVAALDDLRAQFSALVKPYLK